MNLKFKKTNFIRSIIIVCFYFSLAFPPGTLRDVIRGENVAVRRLFLILQGDWSIIGLL